MDKDRDQPSFNKGRRMNTAIQHTTTKPNSIQSIEAKDQSIHKALFSLWMDLENNLQTIVENQSDTTESMSDIESKLDEFIDAEDQIANAACQSRAETYEGLLYKLALWRSDTPDFETMPINADRKDRIVYSVFRDLIKITGIDHVKSETDSKTNFLGLEPPRA